MKRFKRIDGPDGTLDSDTKYYARSFTGKLTKARAAKLDYICSRHTWRESCGHKWDCCGCQFQESWRWVYAAGQVTIIIKKDFNY